MVASHGARHEIAHDVANHYANQRTIHTSLSVTNTAGQVLSYVPGPVGWAGAAVSWLTFGASHASSYLYGRQQELEADRLETGAVSSSSRPAAG